MASKTKSIASAGAERYVITCALRSPDVLTDLSCKLSAEDFYYLIYKYSYQICLSMIEKAQKPEPMTIYNKLEAMGVGKPEHLKELELLSKASYDIQNLNEYVETIKNYSARRQLIDALELSKQEMVENDELDYGMAVNRCEERILTVGNKVSNTEDTYRIGSNALEVLSIRAANPLEVPGIPTGFAALDQDLQGLQPGRLYVLTARQKVGKSVFLMNIARHVAVEHGIPVLIIDTEMPSQQVEDRMVSLITGIDEMKIRNGMFAQEEGAALKVSKAMDVLEAAEIYHHYVFDFSSDKIISLARKYRMQKNVGLIIFDYIKTPDNADLSAAKEHQQIGYLTSALKNKIAGALDVPVLTAAQLGRSAIGASESSDEHIADSDRIGRYADCVITLREKTEEEKEKYGCSPHTGNMVCGIHMSRSGPSKERLYDIYFDRPKMKMSEVKVRKI